MNRKCPVGNCSYLVAELHWHAGGASLRKTWQNSRCGLRLGGSGAYWVDIPTPGFRLGAGMTTGPYWGGRRGLPSSPRTRASRSLKDIRPLNVDELQFVAPWRDTGVAMDGDASKGGIQRVVDHVYPSNPEQFTAPWIPHLIGPAGVTDCFRCHRGAPHRGWIPAFAGMTEVGNLGPRTWLRRQYIRATLSAWNRPPCSARLHVARPGSDHRARILCRPVQTQIG